MDSKNIPISDRLERAVEATEERLAAEIVVVIAPRSGNYHDAELRASLWAALLLFAFVLYGPLELAPRMILLDVSIFVLLTHVLVRRIPRFRKVFTRKTRRRNQVRDAADGVFTREAVGSVRDRSGILVYLSLFEEQLVVLADQGILARVAPGQINEVSASFHESDESWDIRLEKVIRLLGDNLSESLPRPEGRKNELPNKPRFLS